MAFLELQDARSCGTPHPRGDHAATRSYWCWTPRGAPASHGDTARRRRARRTLQVRLAVAPDGAATGALNSSPPAGSQIDSVARDGISGSGGESTEKPRGHCVVRQAGRAPGEVEAAEAAIRDHYFREIDATRRSPSIPTSLRACDGKDVRGSGIASSRLVRILVTDRRLPQCRLSAICRICAAVCSPPSGVSGTRCLPMVNPPTRTG